MNNEYKIIFCVQNVTWKYYREGFLGRLIGKLTTWTSYVIKHYGAKFLPNYSQILLTRITVITCEVANKCEIESRQL